MSQEVVNVVLGILGSVALGFAGYSVTRILKVDRIEDKVQDMDIDIKYIRTRVDSIFDHLLSRR